MLLALVSLIPKGEVRLWDKIERRKSKGIVVHWGIPYCRVSPVLRFILPNLHLVLTAYTLRYNLHRCLSLNNTLGGSIRVRQRE